MKKKGKRKKNSKKKKEKKNGRCGFEPVHFAKC